METKDYETILNDLQNHVIAKNVGVTDFNDGSIIKTIFESIANILEEAYVNTRLGYESNLTNIATSIFNFERKKGTKATVFIQFSRKEANENSLTIPLSTIVSDGTHNFLTTEIGEIKAGEILSNLIPAQAENVGTEYNVLKNTITNIESNISNEISEVTNPQFADGGMDEETNTAYIKRFKTYINGLQGTSIYGFKAGVTVLEKVRSVSIEEHFPPKLNIYNVTLYVDDGTGGLADELKGEIRNILDGDNTEANPGLRPVGINVDIQPATILEVQVSAKCTIYKKENVEALFDIENVLKKKVNSLAINENLYVYSISNALQQLGYITNVRDIKLNGLSEDIETTVSQVIRLGKLDIKLINE